MSIRHCILAGLCLLGVAAQSLAANRPNVILIMADDLGYETIGANGGTSYKTPVLDQLAAEGARFEQCYVQPLCTPTRVQMMTGAYNVRNYITFGEMDPSLRTFGNLFLDAGYKTAICGKWQLGQDPELPRKFGFENHCLWQHTRRPPRYTNPGLEIDGVEKDYTSGEYGPQLVNDYACEFIRQHKSEPFFIYYPMILTHSPYQPTPDSPEYDVKQQGENANKAQKYFGHMVEYMDKLIGRVVTTLDEQGIRDNTLLIFVGDNGTGAGTKSMMGDREVIGGKGRTNASGMHVPLIASWPRQGKPGVVCSDLIDSTDFLATICDAAGIPIPEGMIVDGRSFLPQVKGQTGDPRSWVYSWYSPRTEKLREFAFNQSYKLYRNGEFFDLQSDRGEQQPLSVDGLQGEAATAARELQAALDQFTTARPDHLPKRELLPAGEKPVKSTEEGEPKVRKRRRAAAAEANG